MRHEITIDIAPERMERNHRRMEARRRGRYVDRVPVGFCLVPRYFAPLHGVPYGQLFSDAETQYYWQLRFAAHRIERIPEDMFCTGPTLTVAPYFDNVLDSEALGAQVVWPENETLQACPTLHSVEAMERFEIPPPDRGLWGRLVDWCQQMRDLAAATRVRFGRTEGRVVVAPPSIGGLSPHMLAIDLVGTDFYWWQIEYPEACHRFLAKITQALLQTQHHFDRLWPRPRAAQGLAEDSAQVMSLADFRTFCVPYDLRLYETLAGPSGERVMHMCGQSTHLHPALVDDLRITEFCLFGYAVDPRTAARTLGGRMRLWGNINPMLMLQGTREQVVAEATAALEALAPCGGLLLGDGANVCPGTPVANLAALTDAAEAYGVPPGLEADATA
jgi:uroporphyrinogen-III decarboxylase